MRSLLYKVYLSCVWISSRDEYHLYGERAGLQGFILRSFGKELDFTYDTMNPADNDWGKIHNDSHWTGKVNALVTGEADLTSYQGIYSELLEVTTKQT